MSYSDHECKHRVTFASRKDLYKLQSWATDELRGDVQLKSRYVRGDSQGRTKILKLPRGEAAISGKIALRTQLQR